MKNRFKKPITIFLIVLTIAISSGLIFTPNSAFAQQQNETKNSCGWTDLVCYPVRFISELALRISAMFLSLVGLLFNSVLNYTIVDMAKWINDDAGLGGSIDNAWATLRDLANIVFIFILLWAAIQTILELNTQNFGKTIKNIIIIALLINFSLFFAKVVIDASNIITIGFYNSIYSAAQTTVQIDTSGGTSDTQKTGVGGFSGIIMNRLGIQSWYGKSSLAGLSMSNLMVIGIMGSITMLIVAIVLLVALVLFITRFILLIILLILSPLAFICYTIPALSGNFKKWWDALVDQAFFAPYFMLLMWVAIKLIYSPGFIKINGEFSQIADPSKIQDQGVINLFLNFILVIGFIVAALILSKSMASKTAGFKAISAGVGAVSVGAAAWAGRNTVGRYSNRVLNDTDLRKRAAEGDIGARMKLATAEKLSRSSFDVRGTADSKLGKALGAGKMLDDIGKASGKDGFKKSIEEKEKAFAKIAKERYGQTDIEKADVGAKDQAQKEAKKEHDQVRSDFEKKKKEESESIRSRRAEEAEKVGKEVAVAQEEFNKKNVEAEQEKKTRMSAGQTEVTAEEAVKKIREEAETKLNEARAKHEAAKIKIKAEILDGEYSSEVKALEVEAAARKTEAEEKKKAWEAVKDNAKNRQEAFAKRVERGYLATAEGEETLFRNEKGLIGTRWIGNLQGNKAAAIKIRTQAKGKSAAKEAEDALKRLEKERKEVEGKTDEEGGPKEEKGGGEEGGEKKET